MKDIFRGQLVRLAVVPPEEMGRLGAEWNRDTEYMRLMDSDPTRLFSATGITKFVEKQSGSDPVQSSSFAVRVLADDALIGHVSLSQISWSHRTAWLGIGIGHRDYWGKGYGTDAVDLILRYAFTELNLRRVSLGVFEYNQRAIRSYEKAGFQVEGRYRQAFVRGGRRFDEIYMGVLREDWLERGEAPASA